jgi:hypothetical protein
MGKSAPAAPAPPDPYKTAAAQTGSNIQTGIAQGVMGNANIVNPLGSTINSQTGTQTIKGPNGESYEVPRFTQTTTLSPTEQGLYDQQAGLRRGYNDIASDQMSRVKDMLSAPLDLSGLPQVSGDFAGAGRDRVEKALFDRLSPQLESGRAALETNLTNQGFQRGTEAFNKGMDQYGRQENDARLAVTAQGLQEQQGLFGMEQANRSRALQEMLIPRNQSLNELNAFTSGGQVNMPQAPGWNAPQVAPTDVSSNVYNSAALQQKQYEQQMAQKNAEMGGMFGLGQAGIMGAMKYAPMMFPSDRRLKRDIVDLGLRLVNGLKLYAYRYIGEGRERVGVMADEVARVNPAAVSTFNGFLAVNYRAL